MNTTTNNSEITSESPNKRFTASLLKFHGAAIVDSQGREIPITEHMVQSALNHVEENAADNSVFRTLHQLLLQPVQSRN